MMLKKVAVILNPAASKEVPILALLNDVFQKNKIEYDVLITKKKFDGVHLAEQLKKNTFDAVVVYGGDGLVTEAASVLYATKLPMIILPAGTANILAKELKIPTDLAEALKIFNRKTKKVEIDVSLIHKKQLMFLRIEVGVLAEMVKKTQRKNKEILGRLAYPIAALKEFANAKTVRYSLTLDGKKTEVEGIGLMIANVGNIGIEGISLQSNISCTDSKLDVFVLQSNDLQSLLAVGSSALMGTQKPASLKHWRAKSISVKFTPKQTVILDDKVVKLDNLEVEVQPETLTVYV